MREHDANEPDHSTQELEEAYDGSAPAANRFIVTVGRPGVRIAFLEQAPGSERSRFRSAALLHPLDAIALKDLLNEMLMGIEERLVSDPETAKPRGSKDD